MKLSVVIPAYNEELNIEKCVDNIISTLRKRKVNFEVLVVNDNSKDNTNIILKTLKGKFSEFNCIDNIYPKGFGFAVRTGLEFFNGDVVAIVMADGSDDPEDIYNFFKKIAEGYDCVFGSRFISGGNTYGYPKVKYILNRLVNMFIKILFGIKYNDTTNAFKMYRRKTIEGLKPFISNHFNLTVELPLKAIIRGYSYVVIPNSWRNRSHGQSNLVLKEMGSRYLFIVLYCLIEKWLSVGDYKKDE